MDEKKDIVPREQVEGRILHLRCQKVMLDADLAEIYGVPTKRLNEQVKRNRNRFPEDFMFQLTAEEKEEVVANCDHLSKLRFSPGLPQAFTEHGAVMLASVLNSPRAIEASLFVVRAFVRLRVSVAAHEKISAKLEELAEQCDARHRSVLDALKRLLASSKPKGPRIGFRGGQ